MLEHLTIDSPGEHRASVIWLHGLGADGHDFEPVVPALKLPEDHGIKFIFPHAPVRPVSINDGEEMRAWYDFVPHSESGSDDIVESNDHVRAFVDHELSLGIPSERIILAGFSQGGVMSLYTGLRFPQRLAGIIALSTYLHDASATEAERHDANLALPIFMAHGTQDPMIPIMQAATSRENLIRMGYDVRWIDYPMGHQVCIEEVEEISTFMQEVLK